MKLYKVLVACLLVAGISIQANATTTITSFQNGEVFDGGSSGTFDGVGDEAINATSSYFKQNQSGFPSLEGQAMAYFTIPTLNIGSALFEWDVQQTQGGGAPSITAVYGMLNDSSLSVDDFNKGILLGNVNTSGFTTGSTISLDITSFLQGFSGNLGIRLESTAPINNPQNAKFVTMANGNARITVVPVPAALWLFGTGLIGLLGMRKRNSAVSV